MAKKDITVQCCVCGRIKSADGWNKERLKRNRQYSHGYCPDCFNRAMTEIANLKAARTTANI